MNQKLATKYRPPIVTILGHVDHGKTTLLDAIRKSNITAKEHGGITQHIGAYQIDFQQQPITFVDTPGHAAFEKMRSRGAEVADIAILVVAANDSVKPQTVEAIKHIKKTKIPTIVAITKVDLPNINIEKVKKDLQKEEILVESYGGEVPVVEVAATKEKGIKDLLEMIQLVWQISPEPSEPKDPLQAVVVEAFLDKSRGAIVSVIVKKGTLSTGQKIQVDDQTIKVKSLIDDLGKTVKEAIPAKPVEILGFKKILDVGSIVYETIKTKSENNQTAATHDDIIAKNLEVRGKFKIIIKADVLGSLEAITANLPENVLVISSGIGEVQSTDVEFAKASKAPIIAFNIKVASNVQRQADQEHVLIRSYQVIYKLLEDMEEIARSFAVTKHEIKIKGKAQIVATFNIDGLKIAGAKVTQGKLSTGDKIILRSTNGNDVESEISSLKKFRKEVQSVVAGQECGIGFVNTLDFKEGDIIESLG